MLTYVVRWLQDGNTIQYYLEDHPAARDAIVIAVQEVARPKFLPTPAPTPCNSDIAGDSASTPLPSQHITQEDEHSPDDDADQTLMARCLSLQLILYQPHCHFQAR